MKNYAIALLFMTSSALAQTQDKPAPAAPASTTPGATSTAGTTAPTAGKKGQSMTASVLVTGTIVAPRTAQNTPSTTITVTQQDGSVQQIIAY